MGSFISNMWNGVTSKWLEDPLGCFWICICISYGFLVIVINILKLIYNIYVYKMKKTEKLEVKPLYPPVPVYDEEMKDIDEIEELKIPKKIEILTPNELYKNIQARKKYKKEYADRIIIKTQLEKDYMTVEKIIKKLDKQMEKNENPEKLHFETPIKKKKINKNIKKLLRDRKYKVKRDTKFKYADAPPPVKKCFGNNKHILDNGFRIVKIVIDVGDDVCDKLEKIM